MSVEPAFWSDEDGDRYFFEKHVDLQEMQKRARAFEVELGGLDSEQDERISAASSSYCWVRWDPVDDEAPGEIVEEGTPRAVPLTMLSL